MLLIHLTVTLFRLEDNTFANSPYIWYSVNLVKDIM